MESVSVTAIPDEGFYFNLWDEGTFDTNSPCTLTFVLFQLMGRREKPDFGFCGIFISHARQIIE
jgi:hypothetical protein